MNPENHAADLAAATSLMQLAGGYRVSRAIFLAAKLGIADWLAGRTMSSAELARSCGVKHGPLLRLMRALCALGVFEEGEPDQFGLTAAGRLLQRDIRGSIRNRVLFCLGETGWRAWGDVLYSVETGNAAFDHVYGMQTFDYWAAHPKESAIHDAAMAEHSALVAELVITAYDFSRFHTVVDIGGGTGVVLRQILAACPSLHGILFDVPHVIARASQVLPGQGIAGRYEIREGDFFSAVPAGGDAYLLKYVLHDWDDERAVAILRSCRRVMMHDATLIIVEHVLPDKAFAGNAVEGYMTDLEMLVRTPGGRERTEAESKELLAASGFRLRRCVSVLGSLSVLDAECAMD
jgi:ubiquinone/menaquinone biosynthesis C-methylase UbiE